MSNGQYISVIVVCRDEEEFIAACLDSILANDYPKDDFEIIVVDGMSDDGTRKIINEYIKKYPRISLLDNSRKFTSWALNIGIRAAKGDYIAFMGSHNLYDSQYLSKCVYNIKKYNADNVGGVWKILPYRNSLINKAIVFSSSSFFGAGNAYYRRGYKKGIREVDTVFGGFFRKSTFEKIGMFNEKLIRSQDIELNMRLKNAGGKIMLFPDVECAYYPKPTFREFLKHNFNDGVWAVYPLKFVKMPFKLRHYIPLIFFLGLFSLSMIALFWRPAILVLAVSIVFYFAVSLCFSLGIAIREKDWRYVFLMPIAFAIRHFGYGAGSAWGMIRLVTPQNNGGKS